MSDAGTHPDIRARQWRWTGLVSLGVSLIFFVVMQPIKGDWIPPEISISQYGVGPHGWLFSAFLLTFAASPVLLDRAAPTRRFLTVMLVVGLLGCAVMAFVPTDPGGLQQSARAKIHMVGAVFGLSMTPLGTAGILWWRRLAPRWLIGAVTLISTVAIVLLLITATGVDTLGLGPTTSWAIWQTVASLADIAVVILLALVAHRAVPGVTEGHLTS